MINDIVTKHGGKIVFDDLSVLDEKKKIADQIDDLKEDLFQATFSNDRILDIGWYPSFEPTGSFHIKLVFEHDWDNPIFSDTARSFEKLSIAVEMAVKKIT